VTNIWTIAVASLRQQKVMLIVFAVWIVGFDAIFAFTFRRSDDISDFNALFAQQQCVYGVILAVFVASSVLRNERNSRRILAILSKGVTRAEYLAGHTVGIGLLVVLYFASAGSLFWIIRRFFAAPAAVVSLVLAGIIAALLATTVTLIFATWLHPLLAAALAIVLLGAPTVLLSHSNALVVAPVAYFIRSSVSFDPALGWTGPWSYWPIALVEIAASWLIASLIFARQDVAVPTE
jgi:hypothetical protein